MTLNDDVKKVFFGKPFLHFLNQILNGVKHKKTMKNWDSFAQLNLITLAEAKFEITFSDDEVTSISSAKKSFRVYKNHTYEHCS